MKFTCKEINFTITQEGELFKGTFDGQESLSCTFNDSILSFSIKYSFNDKPLTLTSEASMNDCVKIIILPFRIELYINNNLEDEEWPYGDHYIDCSSISGCNCELSIKDSNYFPKKDPSVVGTFKNAEGWQPEAKVFVGDCMPYNHEGVYHVLYLKDRHRHQSKWRKGAHQWSHISTKNFVNWEIHPMAVEIDDPKEGSICTGSWIYFNNKHYLYYTVRMCDNSPATICRSVSDDGYHFSKDKSFHFVLSEKYTGATARDPKIVIDEQGMFHMILTTSLAESGLGCLAHLVSSDLTNWDELAEPLYIAPADLGEPECPDHFYKDGYYYLVYSLKAKGYYLYSKEPFSDWKKPQDPIIPCKSVPKAATWNNRLIFTGFAGNGKYAGTLTFLEAKVQENGELKFNKLNP